MIKIKSYRDLINKILKYESQASDKSSSGVKFAFVLTDCIIVFLGGNAFSDFRVGYILKDDMTPQLADLLDRRFYILHDDTFQGIRHHTSFGAPTVL